jgi:hypothetical protein
MKASQRKSKMILTKRKCFETQKLSDILSCLYHHRCISAKPSPYQNQTSIERLKRYLKTNSHNKSPTFPIKTSSKPFESKSNSKLNNKKSPTSNFNINVQVAPNSEDIKIAPKLYPDQLFLDTYDIFGNYTRVMITPHSSSISNSENDSMLISGELIISESANQSTNSDIQIKQPENSYNSQQKIPEVFHSDLLQKLSNLKDSF